MACGCMPSPSTDVGSPNALPCSYTRQPEWDLCKAPLQLYRSMLTRDRRETIIWVRQHTLIGIVSVTVLVILIRAIT